MATRPAHLAIGAARRIEELVIGLAALASANMNSPRDEADAAKAERSQKLDLDSNAPGPARAAGVAQMDMTESRQRRVSLLHHLYSIPLSPYSPLPG